MRSHTPNSIHPTTSLGTATETMSRQNCVPTSSICSPGNVQILVSGGSIDGGDSPGPVKSGSRKLSSLKSQCPRMPFLRTWPRRVGDNFRFARDSDPIRREPGERTIDGLNPIVKRTEREAAG